MKDFARNLKDCLKECGIKKTPKTFLLNDTQLIHGLMLEYINGVLNTGDAPNLYAQQQDKDDITQALQSEANKIYGSAIDSNVMKVYLRHVQQNIHVVLAMSPLGNSFMNRLRMFPSLVNCCTLDWFSEWPEDALESVALDNFRKESIIIDDDTIVKVVSACKYIHKRVEKESKVFSERMRRFVYLTPTSYIELLSLYRRILNMKEMEISEKKKRLLKGLEVLRGAGVEVDKMNQEITKQKPELEKAKKETAILAADLKIKAAAAEEVKAAAIIKEEAAKKFDAECEVILKQSKEELDKVMPLVEKAKNSINKISPDDLRTQTSYNKLNSGCKVLFAALLYFLKGNEWKLKQYEVKDSNPKEYNIKEAVSYINFSKYEKLLETLRNFCSNELLNS